MTNWDWEDIWIGLLITVIGCGLSLALYAGFQNHAIQHYFMAGSAPNRNGYCIDGYRNWYSNEYSVFCSDDVQKTITVLGELNKELATRKLGH